MDKAEIQSIVEMTVQELKRQGMLRDRYSIILRDTEPAVKDFFNHKNNKKIEAFFRDNSDDPYIDVIYLHYRDNVTLGEIASILDKDESTVKRNKKRLMIKLHDILQT